LQVVRRRPFRPFSLRLTSGDQFDVADEFHVGCSDHGNVVYLFAHPPLVRIDADKIATITEPQQNGEG
jgi:hypothetical protein